MAARAPSPDPVLAAIDAAPADDRELGDHEQAALVEARTQVARGEARVMSSAAVEAWIASSGRPSSG